MTRTGTVLVPLGVATGVLSIVPALRAVALERAINAGCHLDAPTPECTQQVDRGYALVGVTWGLVSTGAALTIVGAVLLSRGLALRPTSLQRRAASLRPSFGPAGVFLTGHF